MADAEEIARMFKLLSVEARVRIVQLLNGRALCVGALAARLDITQGAVSQHLRVLRDAGMVEAEKRGYFVHYRVKPEAMKRLEEAASGFVATGEGKCRTKNSREGGVKCATRKRKAVRSRKT